MKYKIKNISVNVRLALTNPWQLLLEEKKVEHYTCGSITRNINMTLSCRKWILIRIILMKLLILKEQTSLLINISVVITHSTPILLQPPKL